MLRHTHTRHRCKHQEKRLQLLRQARNRRWHEQVAFFSCYNNAQHATFRCSNWALAIKDAFPGTRNHILVGDSEDTVADCRHPAIHRTFNAQLRAPQWNQEHAESVKAQQLLDLGARCGCSMWLDHCMAM